MKFFLILFLLMPSPSIAASFNCIKAKSKIEETICNDRDLSDLDNKLSLAFHKALSSHPLPSYLQSQQRDWLHLLNFVDQHNMRGDLIESYLGQIKYLSAITKDVQVYVNNLNNSKNKFCRSCGDSVIEIWNDENKKYLRLYGGFVIHIAASEDNRKPEYTGCEFTGEIAADQKSAKNEDGAKIIFRLINSRLILDDNSSDMCYGFGRLTSREFSLINPSL